VLRPAAQVLAQSHGSALVFSPPLLLQPGLRDPYAQSYFAGLSSGIGDFWQWEISGLGSSGSKLITTDQVNRHTGVFNAALPPLNYRANQGHSSFNGLNATLRHRSPAWQAVAIYTWSHAIDNQSDPLAGDFFDLSFIGNRERDASRAVAAFSRQYDSRADRGNSDFDQRQSLVAVASYQVPRFGDRWQTVMSRWRISAVGSLRSGLPFTIFAPGSADVVNRRASYVGGPQHIGADVEGGVQWLNPAAFVSPASGQGNLGRNSLRAPSFYSADAALAKTFGLPGESRSITLRLDAFNLLNHSNLDRPLNVIGSTDFGVALFGRHGAQSSFPAALPLDETPRQLQIGLRFDF